MKPNAEHQTAPSGPQRPAQPAATGVLVLCPYCGSLSAELKRCTQCGGHFDLLSRQRTQNAMGAWFIRDQVKPFHPGCSYATLCQMIRRGRVKPETVLRGPTTRQFWSFAHSTPGVSHLLGRCYACGNEADAGQSECRACGASFLVATDRQQLGLSPMHLLPGEAGADEIAHAAFGSTPPDSNGTAASLSPNASHAQPEPTTTETQDRATEPLRAPGRPRRKQPIGAAWLTTGAALLLGGIAVAVILIVQQNGVAQQNEAAGPSAPTSVAPPPFAPTDKRLDPSQSGEPGEPAAASVAEADDPPSSTEAIEAEPVVHSPGPTEQDSPSTPADLPDTPSDPAASRPASTLPPGWLRAITQQSPDELREERQAIESLDPALAEALDRRQTQLRLRAAFSPES